EACAALAAAAVERVEDRLPLGRGDAAARVGHPDGGDPAGRDAAQLQLVSARRPAEGVVEQVVHDLEHAIAVGDDGRRAVDRRAEVDVDGPGLLAEGAGSLLPHGLAPDLLARHPGTGVLAPA